VFNGLDSGLGRDELALMSQCYTCVTQDLDVMNLGSCPNVTPVWLRTWTWWTWVHVPMLHLCDSGLWRDELALMSQCYTCVTQDLDVMNLGWCPNVTPVWLRTWTWWTWV